MNSTLKIVEHPFERMTKVIERRISSFQFWPSAFNRAAPNARAETALAAIEARADGWPPAVRSLAVNFKKAA